MKEGKKEDEKKEDTEEKEQGRNKLKKLHASLENLSILWCCVFNMLLDLPCVHKFLCWEYLKPQREFLYLFIDFFLNKFLKV